MTKLCFNFDRTQKRGTRRTITKKILQEKLFPNFFRGRITPRNLFSQFLFSFGFKSTIIIHIFSEKNWKIKTAIRVLSQMAFSRTTQVTPHAYKPLFWFSCRHWVSGARGRTGIYYLIIYRL